MLYRDIQGISVPALGFGTFQLQGQTCIDMVRSALELGYRHIDTASMYGNEVEVGKGLAAAAVPREEVFLTTKVWHDQLTYADVKRSLNTSLGHLGVSRVDLFLVHWPNPAVSISETLKALHELKSLDKTRLIGVCNFPVALLQEAVDHAGADDLFCNQVEYHPFLSQRPVLEFLRHHDMLLTAYSPLAQGKTAQDDTLNAIGAKYGKSGPQVALRWLLDQDHVAAIPRTSNPQRLADNLAALEFELSAEDRTAVDTLQGNHRLVSPSFAPHWDTV